MKLKLLLIEITLDKALQVLSLSKSDLGNDAVIKQAYRTASLSAHPDRGGSTEAQQEVNAAYELIKTQKGSSGKFDWESTEREYYEMGVRILQQLKTTINPKNFTDYFQKIYNIPFQFEITSERPSGEFKRYGNYNYAGFVIKFFDSNKDIVFNLNVDCYLPDAKRSASIGSGIANISYNLFIVAYGLYNNKKLKLSSRDWKMTTNHDTLINPELTFPKSKLDKFKTTAAAKLFRKADMITTLTQKTGMTWDGEFLRYTKSEFKPYLMLRFNRGVFMKMPWWSVQLFEGGQGVRGLPYLTLPETIETANFLIELFNKFKAEDDKDRCISIIKSELEKKKGEKI